MIYLPRFRSSLGSRTNTVRDLNTYDHHSPGFSRDSSPNYDNVLFAAANTSLIPRFKNTIRILLFASTWTAA
jgi:hypothetical protein